MISAILPDLDTLYFYFKFKSLRYQKNVGHRNWVSHAPLIYLVLGLLFFFGSYSSFYSSLALVFMIGSFSHFTGDSIEYGAMWLYPFSKRKFALMKAPKDSVLFYRKNNSSVGYYWDLVTKVYMRGGAFYFEVIVVLISLVVLFFSLFP